MTRYRDNLSGDTSREQMLPHTSKQAHRYVTKGDRWKLRGVTTLVIMVSALIIIIWGYGAWSTSRDMIGRPIPEIDMFREASHEIGDILGRTNRTELDDVTNALTILGEMNTVSTTFSTTSIISTSTESSFYGN